MMLIITGLLSKTSNVQPDPNLIAIPFSSSKYKNENYEVILQRIEDAGFTNISVTRITDLVTGFLTKDGEVESVTINGLDKFSEGDKYNRSVKITITYHTFRDKAEPTKP